MQQYIDILAYRDTLGSDTVSIHINYLLPESLVFTCARILFLVSLLFVAQLDPFDPYLPFKFLIFY